MLIEGIKENYQKFKKAFQVVDGDQEPLRSEEASFEGKVSLYPYRIYDEIHDLYINKGSYGFIIEIAPLCGADENTVKILTSMITDGVGEGHTLQIINWASPKVGDYLDRWKKERVKTGGIYKKLAEKRHEYYKEAHIKPLASGSQYVIRDFRVIIAVSCEGELTNKGKEEMKSLRVQLKTTLKGIGVDSWDMAAESFINFMDEIVNPSFKQEREHIYWNKHDTLADNIATAGTVLEVEPGCLKAESDDGELDIVGYSVSKFPTVWAAWMTGDLIGATLEDYLRIPCPFLTMFAFTFDGVEKANNVATIKSVRTQQQLEQGLGKFVSGIADKARDWKFVTEKIGDGQKLVKSHYEIILYAPRDKRRECEQALKSLYSAKGWKIMKERYVQLQTWLSCLPFMHSEGIKKDLKKFSRLKTMLTWTCANVAPMHGEWKGMEHPYLMLFGRRGQPMYWNPFANKEGNYNVAVFGKSGAGKSVFMQELVSSIRGAGGNVIIIDDGYSFHNSTVLQGGEFVKFSGVDWKLYLTLCDVNDKIREEVIDQKAIVVKKAENSYKISYCEGRSKNERKYTTVEYAFQPSIDNLKLSEQEISDARIILDKINEEKFNTQKSYQGDDKNKLLSLISKFIELRNGYSPEKPLCLNPFSILNQDAYENDKEYRADASDLLRLVIGKMARSQEKPTDMENTYIEEAVDKVFKTKGTKGSIRDVREAIAEIDDKRAQDLSRMLFKYTEGAYKEYFQGENEVSFENSLIAFELSAIKGHRDLLSIVLMILMFLVTEKMYRGGRKVNISLVIDECWSMLKGEGSGEFIEGIARRARKYEGNIISGTQSLNDYYKTEASKATIEQTDWLCILPHKPEAVRDMKKAEKVVMDEHGVMESMIKSLKKIDNEYGEVMIYGPNGWSIGRLLLDPYSLALYTSKGTEYRMIEEAVEKGIPLEDAINLVAEKIKKTKQ